MAERNEVRRGPQEGTDYAPGQATWRSVLRRAGWLVRRSRTSPRPGWWLGVPVIALAAGLLFTTSATTAGSIPLREDSQVSIPELIAEREARVAEAGAAQSRLEEEVDNLTAGSSGADSAVTAQQRRAQQYLAAAGLTEVAGRGLTVAMEDALREDGSRPPGAVPDDLLVHQQDVQAVVNALWAGGAEAMSIMGERIIATSAVLCVGPVLLLHGRPHAPPYVITAVGEPDQLRAALAASPGVQLFRDAVDAYGLGYRERVEEVVTVPAFEGSTSLRNGQVAG